MIFKNPAERDNMSVFGKEDLLKGFGNGQFIQRYAVNVKIPMKNGNLSFGKQILIMMILLELE